MVVTRSQSKRQKFLATVKPKRRLEDHFLQALEEKDDLDLTNEILLEIAVICIRIKDIEKLERAMKEFRENTRELKRIRRRVEKIIVLEKL